MLETSPQNFGRYEVKLELGCGAMGVVYRAHDPMIGRDVAIKTIKRTLDLPENKRSEYLERFRREAQAAGKLSDHPNIVPVFDVGREGDLPYIVMAYIEGESLDRRRRKQAFDDEALEALVRDMCSALEHAHRNGTIHRDVKPANILLTPRGAMLTDFGIARLDGSELTRAGTFLGSPSYMSPEQVRGGDLTGTSDLFSLAVILYMLITGEKPFKGEDTNEILYKIVHDPHPPPSERKPALARWDGFFERALSKKAAARFADAAAFHAGFCAVVTGTEETRPTATEPTRKIESARAPAAPATRQERINPLAERSMFFNVDVKDRIPRRSSGSTTSGRLERLLKGGRRRRSRSGLPPAVWAGLLAVALALTGLVYALWSDDGPSTPVAAEAEKG